ncbi:hypothetical protein DSLASN_09420 [Desulfoluna limicola]|uniref:Histidine kinase n=1 Tax=Desulfoluna limicola TaxID=2810562 RepID=A0ABN6F122_9BACT|nr:hypothetical protein [Desulfoluna limicola]BCS95310.1 hypothetical protein DSLASN_09420 [Desulfoluna limicola]
MINTTKERLLLAAIAVITFVLAGRFDVLETLVDFSRRHEAYEIDEVITVCLVLVVCQAILLHRRFITLRQGKEILARKNRELEGAMEEIKQLKGILPICASCKKIRDDDGFWHQVETYLSSHSDAQFSHGLCPSCVKELYGEYLVDRP